MVFNITVDKQLDAKHDFDIIVRAIQNLSPFLNCYNSEIILSDNRRLNLKSKYTWFDIASTPDDERWSSAIDFQFFPDDILQSNFPQIELTEQINEALTCNSLCNKVGEIISGLDKHDPYCILAYVDQQWYLADTANMKFMGPYIDGINETAGNAKLNLLYKPDLSNLATNLYNYDVLKRYGSQYGIGD